MLCGVSGRVGSFSIEPWSWKKGYTQSQNLGQGVPEPLERRGLYGWYAGQDAKAGGWRDDGMTILMANWSNFKMVCVVVSFTFSRNCWSQIPYPIRFYNITFLFRFFNFCGGSFYLILFQHERWAPMSTCIVQGVTIFFLIFDTLPKAPGGHKGYSAMPLLLYFEPPPNIHFQS